MDEHRSAQLVLQRALACGGSSGAATGAPAAGAAGAAAPVDPHELGRALAHVACCEACRRRFDLAETLAWLESREETREMARVPVDPTALFESALTTALADPDEVVRRRAAERLGEMTQLTAAAVDALVAAAKGDRDQRVRTAALSALQRPGAEAHRRRWMIDA